MILINEQQVDFGMFTKGKETNIMGLREYLFVGLW